MEQQELPLPFPELTGDTPPLPARMVNEFSYCPRLAYLEWVQGEWEASHHTVEGDAVHKRVDKPGGALPEPDEIEDTPKLHARSVTLESAQIGLVAKLDLLEADGGSVVPVDYKRGKRPHVDKGAYEPERIQLCAQGLLLEAHGYTVDHGILYFAGSKERVQVEFDAELRALTQSAINGLRLMAAAGRIPPPLEDSPKCPRCSLVGICLPDEVNFLKKGGPSPRPMAVNRDEAMPVYVQANHAKVAKKGERLEISIDDAKVSHARLIDTSQLVLMGNVYVTTPTLQELMRREIPVSWYSYGGWFLGHTVGVGHKNVELRTAQYKASFDPQTCLRLARGWVEAKIANQRVILRRNWRGDSPPDELQTALKNDIRHARLAKNQEELLGIEGAAAARYFGVFGEFLKPTESAGDFSFDFAGRNRRPPPDPVNALLSFAYAMLTRTLHQTLSGVGLDPYRGFYHQPRYGRPSLALDMMEPFRPILADSAVLTAINNGEVRPSDFVRAGGGVALSPEGRKRFIGAFERRLSQEITHPIFGYRLSYRRLLEVQARLLGRFLLGELDDNPNLIVR
ncbi:MAG: CRISPR-associated endonuclease Cas1 [Gammaproteobacteria bacterium]|nr:CRISPR-associated endonuclease Cas1 [Gammaproteobacteria bacterium]MCP5135259.1 CRISPR-associated endonuclease Cas1 [Gammaproteobacteria bacterium]